MKKKLRVDIVTLFPEMCEPYLHGSILGRGEKAKALDLRTVQLREFATNKHRRVDDTPYGGGPGMVMQVEPIDRAIKSLKLRGKSRVILTSAKGKLFTQADAKRLAAYDRLVFVCGRYEGIDERVAAKIADEELSIGPYVMTGGELAALVMTDAIARLRPGVLGASESLEMESWSDGVTREYPQYTKPETYRGWSVPSVLLEGNHQKIAEWRAKQSQK